MEYQTTWVDKVGGYKILTTANNPIRFKLACMALDMITDTPFGKVLPIQLVDRETFDNPAFLKFSKQLADRFGFPNTDDCPTLKIQHRRNQFQTTFSTFDESEIATSVSIQPQLPLVINATATYVRKKGGFTLVADDICVF